MTTSFHHHNHHLFSLSTAILLFTLSSATTPPPLLNHACKATRYPTTCQTTLLHHPLLSTNPNPTPYVITRAALSLSSTHLSTALSLSKTILITFPHHRNRSMAATTCLDLLTMSHHRTHIALQKLSSSSRKDDVTTLKDARAWVSAALTYQTDCWSELSYVNHTRVVDQAMSFLESTLIPTTSNALSMMMSLENFGDDVGRWGPPKTERDGFWERVDRNGLDGLRFAERFSKPERANAVVCKKKMARGCHATVQKAVDAAPEGLRGKDKYVIYIKEGVYEEIVRVPLEKSNLVFLGDGMGKTVIRGSINTGILGISTYNTATVGVKGDGFMAMGITFQNTAGPNAHQAVAFRSDSDLSLVENCEFLSNQDTLYVHSLRQVYRSCRIEGNVDFIFGNGAGLFQDCSILVRPRMLDPTKGENNAITAQGRTDPAQKTGFVFLGCLINGTNEYMKLVNDNPKVHHNYLGRPWKMYSRTVFIECYMDRLVSPEGWMPFRDDFALSTLYYGEFGNKGRGADVSKRVGWSSQIRKEHVIAYSARNFVQADEWSSVL